MEAQPNKSYTVKSQKHRISAPRLVAETIVNGKYKIVECLGQGGMSTVYKAEDLGLGRLVALKVLIAKDLDESSYLRFKQEARAIGNLDHPNIVKVFELDEMGNGEPFIVMEYVEGKPLSDVFDVSALPISRATAIVSQACAALQHAHDHGVIHRDIKPSNIMLIKDRNGKDFVKIVDFGIAKLVDTQGSGVSLTQTGEVFGSPMYMSPEQCLGKKLDGRSDIYSLACVLYEAIAGEPPFSAGNSAHMLVQHVNEPVIPLRKKIASMPKRLDQAVQKALAKDPGDRFATMLDFQNALVDFEDVHAPAAVKSTETSLMPLVLGSALGAIVIFVGIWFYITNTSAPPGDDQHRHKSVVAPAGSEPPSPQKWRYDFDNGRILMNQGKHADAAAVLERAFSEAQEARVPAHELADIQRVIGHQYWAMSKFSEATDNYKQAYSFYSSIDAENNAGYMLQCVGACAGNQGQWDEAARYYLKAKNSYQKAYGSHSKEVANMLFALASAKTRSGDPQAAERYSRQCIQINELLYGKNRAAELIRPLEQLALALDNESNYGESASTYLRLSKLASSYYKQNRNMYAAQYLDSAALVLRKAGEMKQANELEQQGAKLRAQARS